jgi:signal transduction histidine kinase
MRPETLREIQTLHHLAAVALTRRPITDVLQTAVESLATLLPADRVSITGFNVEKESVDYFVEGGKGRRHASVITYSELWEGLSGWVLRSGIAALSPKTNPDPRGSVLIAPVRNNQRLLATITAVNPPGEHEFEEGDLETIQAFAFSAAVLIENARLLADLQLSRDLAEVSRIRLAEQNEMKDKLFTILAHDLRGPVGSLSALLGVVEDSPMSVDEIREVVHEGHRSASQTYSLLDNLLGWVRAQMDEVKVLRTRFLAARSLDSVLEWMEPQAKMKGITLELECPPEMTVTADQRMFETIVRNLVSNAVKFSAENTVVTVRGLARGEAGVVEVEDRGEGMAPERLEQLFQHRAVQSELGTRGERGSGLGLMFCADLARALGGTLEAQSTVAKGSTFRLVLPDPVEGEL